MVKTVPPSPFLGRKALTFATAVRKSVIASEPHKWGCLLLPLPADLAREVTAWVAGLPEEDLGPGGREFRPHVTALYGFAPLSTGQLNELRAYLLRNGPITLSLGHEPSLFTKNEDGDVLILDVDSPALEDLHYNLEELFEAPGNKHPAYKPHLTLAYLRPEASARYLRNAPPFAGREVVCDWAEYGAADGSKVTLPLAAAAGLWGRKAFCPTGEGGGIDPTCSPGEAGYASTPQDVVDRAAAEVSVEVSPTGRRIKVRGERGEVEVQQGAGDGKWRLRSGSDVEIVADRDSGLRKAAALVGNQKEATQPPPVSSQPRAVPKTNDLTDDEKGTARSRLAGLPADKESVYARAYNLPAVRVEHLGMTETGWRPREYAGVNEKLGRVMAVPLEGIGTTQDAISQAGLAAYIDRMPDVKKDGLPEVALVDGKYLIMSGHTRLGAVALSGRPYGVAVVYQFDRDGNWIKQRPPVPSRARGTKAMSWQHEAAGGALIEPPTFPARTEQRGPEAEYCPHCDARLEQSEDGVCNRCGKPWPETKGLGDTVQSAGRWLAGKWEQLEQRYGRRAALGMAVAMLATLPVPGNVAAVVAAAEAVRGLHGYWQRAQGGGDQESYFAICDRDEGGRCKSVRPSPFEGRKSLTPPTVPGSYYTKDLSTEVDCHWVTIPADGEGGGGSPVCIGPDGEIRKGPTGLEGKTPDDLGKKEPDRVSMADEAIKDKWVQRTGIRVGDPSKPQDPSAYTDAEYAKLPVVYHGGPATSRSIYVTNDEHLAAMHGPVQKFRLAPGTMVYADPETYEELLVAGYKKGEINGHSALFKLQSGSGIIPRDGAWPFERPTTAATTTAKAEAQPGAQKKPPKVTPENYAELTAEYEKLGEKLDAEEVSAPAEQRYYQKLEAALTAHESRREREFEKQVDKWTKKHEELTDQRGEAESRLDDERFAEHTRRAEAAQADAEFKQEQAAQLAEQFATQAQAARQALEGIVRPQQYEGGDDVLGSYADAYDAALEEAGNALEDPEAGPEAFAKAAERLEKLAHRASTYLTETPEDAQAVASLSRSAGAARQALLAAAGKLQPLREEARRARWAAEAADTAYTGALTAGYDSPDYDPPGSPALAEVRRLEQELAEHAKLEPDYERDLPELWAEDQRQAERQRATRQAQAGQKGLSGYPAKDASAGRTRSTNARGEECHWVTLGGGGPAPAKPAKGEGGKKKPAKKEGGGGGTPVCITGSGEVRKGPPALTGRDVDDLDRNRPQQTAKPSPVAAPKPPTPSDPEVKPVQPAGPEGPTPELPPGKKPKGNRLTYHSVSEDLSDAAGRIAVKDFFGRSVPDDTLAAIANAVDGVTVRLRKVGDTLSLNWDGQGVDASRTLMKDADGNLYVHNNLFTIDKDSPHKGKGLEFFLSQVQALREVGVDYIETHAAGYKGHYLFNGYYTWPRMGYDGIMQDRVFHELPKELQRALDAKKSRSVLDLMDLPGGKEAWKEHGSDIYDAKFDLREGSRSMRTLAAYLQERAQRGQPERA